VQNLVSEISGVFIFPNRVYKYVKGGGAGVKIGDHVMYKGENCEIVYIYKSGYCELKKPFLHQIVLAHMSELKPAGEEEARLQK
jgi:hypothetical protein